MEAFLIVRDGFSADRVIADRHLNQEFVSLCKRLGVPGQPIEWNTKLLNLRKASRLSGLPQSRKTIITATESDRYDFACEIAIQEFCQKGFSLDNLLCDPAVADEFDARVRCIVKMGLTSLAIRWVALRIRKRESYIRKKCDALRSPIEPPPREYRASALNLEDISERPGLYWLQSQERKLYVGKTKNLRQRFLLQIVDSSFDFWETPQAELEIRFAPAESEVLFGNQSYWIGMWQPVGNYSKLAAL